MWIPKFLTFSLTFRITVMEEIHMNFSQVLQLIQTLQIAEPKNPVQRVVDRPSSAFSPILNQNSRTFHPGLDESPWQSSSSQLLRLTPQMPGAEAEAEVCWNSTRLATFRRKQLRNNHWIGFLYPFRMMGIFMGKMICEIP